MPEPKFDQNKPPEAQEKGPKVLREVVFKKVTRPDGTVEYRSSDSSRKIAILAPGSDFEPEEGKPYSVEVTEDTTPDNPMGGKFYVIPEGMEEAPMVESKLTPAGWP